tara:strand:+ start:577 stop:1332 length:756 start_codon:yes stop_codon:yes gene_type:complete
MLDLKGQAEITVRTPDGEVKGHQTIGNTITSTVRVDLMKEITGDGSYGSQLVPTRIICQMNNMYWSTMSYISGNHSTTGVVGNTVTTSFNVTGLQQSSWPGAATSIATVYLLSTSATIGTASGAEISPNVTVDNNDTIDIIYKMTLTRNDPSVGSGFLVRLGNILRGGNQNVEIDRASIYNGATLLQQSMINLSASGTNTSTNIYFNNVSSLPDRVYFYADAGATPVYNTTISVGGFSGGDNIIVPFSINT